MNGLSTARAVRALWKRELLKFFRDRSRVVGALAQPFGFWILLGLGFQATFQMPSPAGESVGYLEYLFPGILAMVLLFTAIFSTISIVEERTAGALQGALTAPIPRTALVAGNALGGTTLATMQAGLFLLAAPLIGIPIGVGGFLLALAICFVAGLAFNALGFSIAWYMPSTRGFHSVMMLFLLPLWFLSGAFFPAEGAAPVLRYLMTINPVSYVVGGLRHAAYLPAEAPAVTWPLGLCLAITALFCLLTVSVAVRIVRRPLYG